MSLHRLLLGSLRRLLHPQGPLVAAPHCNCTLRRNCTLHKLHTGLHVGLLHTARQLQHTACQLHTAMHGYCITTVCPALATIYDYLRFNDATYMMRRPICSSILYNKIHFILQCPIQLHNCTICSVLVKELVYFKNHAKFAAFAPD